MNYGRSTSNATETEPFGTYKGDIEDKKTCCSCLSFFKTLFSCGTKKPIEEKRYYNSLIELLEESSTGSDDSDNHTLRGGM